MSLSRIKGLLIQEYFITLNSFEVFFDIVVFPITSVIVFGFLAKYLSASADPTASYSLVAGMLLWEIVFIVQYTVSVSTLWNIWSKNLTNMFIAPTSLAEFLFSQFVSATIKAILLFNLSAILAIYVFQFNMYELGATNIVLYFINLALFSLSMGIIILGLIFRYGTRIQSFAWGILPTLQPLTAPFYPVSILPVPLQYVSRILPPTYIFEAARYSLISHTVRWDLIGISLVENSIFFILAIWFFVVKYRQSMASGQFARLDG